MTPLQALNIVSAARSDGRLDYALLAIGVVAETMLASRFVGPRGAWDRVFVAWYDGTAESEWTPETLILEEVIGYPTPAELSSGSGRCRLMEGLDRGIAESERLQSEHDSELLDTWAHESMAIRAARVTARIAPTDI